MEIDERKKHLNAIGKISKFFIYNIQIVILVMIMVLVLGMTSILTLPKESLPEIIFPALAIQLVYPGASAEDVELLITDKIEGGLNGIEDIDEITSESKFGLSFVNVVFEEGVDMDRKKLEVDNILSGLIFPEGASAPESFVFKTSEIPLISFSMAGPYSQEALTNYSNDLKKQLEKINGVEQVNIFGEEIREVQILLNPIKLMEYNISSRDVINAIQGTNVTIPVSEINSNGIRYNFRIDEKIGEIESLKDINMKTINGDDIFISDVAIVIDTFKASNEINRSFSSESSSLNNSLFVEVIRKNESDVLLTSNLIKEKIDEEKGNLYPDDIEIYISQDTAIQVSDDLYKIQNSALSGLIVVIIVLFLFIGFKESVVVSITIPLSLLATFGLLGAFDMTLNTFVVLGLIVSLGLLVDNSIIVMENINRLTLKNYSIKDSAIYGVNQVAYPITAATLTTVAAFFPLAILPGIIGAFVNNIPRTIIITLVASLVIAIVIIPSLYYLIFKGGKIQKDDRQITKIIKVLFIATLSFMAFYNSEIWIGIPIISLVFFGGLMFFKEFMYKENSFENSKIVLRYEKIISSLVRSRGKRAVILLGSVGILAGSLMMIVTGQVKIAFFPLEEPESVVIQVQAPGGITTSRMSDVAQKIEEILKSSKDIRYFNTRVGGNEVNTSLINVEFEDNGINGFDKLTNLQGQMDSIPGAEILVKGLSAGGPPVGAPVEIIIKGENIEESYELAEEYKRILQDMDGVYNVEVSVKNGIPELYFDVFTLKAQNYGITASSLASQLRMMIEGSVATTFIEEGDEIDVLVKLDGDYVDNIEDIYIGTSTGKMMPLSNIGELKETEGLSAIQHTDGNRNIIITADVMNDYNSGVIINEFKELNKAIIIPSGLQILYGGDSEGINNSFNDLFKSMILAVFLVFIILTLQFKSVVQPFIILLTIPMALIGVIWGLYITGSEFGFYAFMALVALVGIAVNDAIVLIDYMNTLRNSGKDFKDSISEAGTTRFNPVLATTLTTIGGILPLAFNDVYYEQFSYSLIFGLFVTTLMTLILIPVLYSIFGKVGFKKEKAGEVHEL